MQVKLKSKVKGKVEEKVKGQVEGQVEGKVEGKVEEKVEGKVEEKVEGKVEEKVEALPELIIKHKHKSTQINKKFLIFVPVLGLLAMAIAFWLTPQRQQKMETEINGIQTTPHR